MSLVIKNGLVATQDPKRDVLRADVLIEDGRIAAIGKSIKGAKTLDASGCAVIPGLVNCHGHAAMALMKGVADDLNLEQFLGRTFAVDARRTRQDVRAGAMLGCLEMLLSGTTTFMDMYYHEDAVAEAVEATGIRGHLGWAVLDDDKTTQKGSPLKNADRFISRFKSSPLVRPLVAPQGVYACSEETLLGARSLAEEHGAGLHMHLQETRYEVHEHEKKTGKRPIAWLEGIGFLNDRLSAAHCVWLTINEIRILKKNGVGVAHCPVSNAKLASGGIAPVPEMRREGVPVGLGTDGSASNNCLDMFQEMKFCALAHKAHRWDATVMNAQEILDMATIDAARAIGAERAIGSIERGKRADLAIVDITAPNMAPTHSGNLVSNLAYSCIGANVRDVIVDGKVVVRGRALKAFDEAKIMKEAERQARKLLAL
ncbi:MAG: amidohydrolase family protein [Euryarchaeota archaeon]|nr:amidohydrolase family protein [Euryarchaeota archaeon]